MSNKAKLIERGTSEKREPKLIEFGLMNIYQKTISLRLGMLIHFISKLQILAIYLMFTLNFFPETYKNVTAFTKLFVRIFVFTDIFEFGVETTYTKVGFFLLELYNFILVALFFIIVFGSMSKKNNSVKKLRNFWGFMIYIYCLLLVFPTFTFNLRIISYWAKGKLVIFNIESTDKIIVPIISVTIICWSIFSIISSKLFLLTTTFPNNSLFSKNNSLQRFEIAEKCALFLIFELVEDNEINSWVLFLLSCIISMLRNIYVFHTLPYYNIRIQYQEVIMNSILTTFSLLNLFAKTIVKSKHRFSSAAVILACVLFGPFIRKIFISRLESIYTKVMAAMGNNTNPSRVLHLIPLYKFFLKENAHVNLNKHKFNFFNMYLQGKSQLMRPFVKENGEKVSFNFDDKEHFKIHFLKLLGEFLKVHVLEWPLRLAFIRLLVEYKYYVQALYFIEQTKKLDLDFTERISLHQIKADLLKKLAEKYKKQKESKLNLLKFLECNNMHDKLRKLMLDQIKTQRNFWRVYMHNKVDFNLLINYSNDVEIKKAKIQYFWRKFEQNTDNSFLSPYLTYGLYLEIINYRPQYSTKIINLFMRKAIGLERLLEKDELSNDTLYGRDNMSIEISGSKENLGAILDCSRSINMVFGYERDYVLGLNVGIIIPDCLKDKHNTSLLTFYETGKKRVLDRTRKIVALNSEGYLLPVFIHVRLNPLVESQISYIGVLKPIKEKKYCLIVTPDGTIDSFTFELGQEFKMTPGSKPNIFEFCSDFEAISDTSNMVALTTIRNQSSDTILLDLEEARTKLLTSSNKKAVVHKSTITDTTSRSEITMPSDKRMLISRKDGKDELEKPSKKTQQQQQQDNYSKLFRTKLTQNMDYETTFNLYCKYRDEGTEIRFVCNQQMDKSSPSPRPSTSKQIIARVRVENMFFGQHWVRIVHIDSMVEKQVLNHLQLRGQVTIKDSPPLPDTSDFEEDKFKNYKLLFKRSKEKSYSNLNLRQGSSRNIFMNDDSPSKLGKQRFDNLDFDNEENQGKKVPRLCLQKTQKFNKEYQVMMSSEEDVSPRVKFIPLNNTQKSRENKLNIKKLSLSAIASENEEENEAEKENEKEKVSKEIKFSAKSLNKEHSNKGNFNHLNEVSSAYFGASTENAKIKIQKSLQEALECKYKTRKYVFFNVAFVSSMALIAIILLLQMILALRSFTDISNKNEIINFANKRLDALVYANFMLRVFYSLIEGKFGTLPSFVYEPLANTYKHLTNDKVNSLNLMNHELRRAVALIDEDLQEEFYIKNVRIYEVDLTGQPTEFTLDNTFSAIQKIISKALKFLSLEKYPPFKKNPDMMFFLYNSYNDLLISNEKSVQILLTDLEVSIASYQSMLWVVSCSAFSVLVLFLLSSIMIIVKMKQGISEFSTFFFRLNDTQVKKIQSCLDAFHEALDNHFQDETLLSHVNFTQEEVKQVEDQNRLRPNSKQINYKNYNTQNQILVFRLWPLVIIVMGLLLGFSVMKIKNIERIYAIQSQNVAVGSNLINQNLGISTLVEMVSANASTTIKNNPIVDEMVSVLDRLAQTDSLINKFRDNNGQIDPKKAELLLNISCSAQFTQRSEGFESTCNFVSLYQGFTGIIAINSRIWQLLNGYASDFLSSNRSLSNQISGLSDGLKLFPNLVLIGRDLNYELWQRVLDEFNEFVDLQTKQTVWFSIFFLVLILFICLMAFPWALFQLNNKDNELKKMLKLIPLSFVLENRWLKTYLIKSSNKILEPLKNIL